MKNTPKNTTWNRKWSEVNASEVATRVKNGKTEVKFPNVGDVFRSDELDDMWCQDMFLQDVINVG